MKKTLSLVLLASIAAATGAYGACKHCEEKNATKNWFIRHGRAAKCWVARKVFRARKHRMPEESRNAGYTNQSCTRCIKRYKR